MQEMIKNDHLSFLSFEISSANTPNECKLRPNADTKYWLTMEELIPAFCNETFIGDYRFNHASLLKMSPNYEKDYFTNHSKLKEIWLRDMKQKRN